ncbi:MAG TPA: respiratory nitrate reductase subunit gamma [Bacillota bacterium]|nr:respiratory nitrate reductase subunit gamma [Bacillota bacterium]
MNTGEQFLWLIFPYLVLTILLVGLFYRFNTDQYGWTSKSSELLEKRLLKWGSTLFHWGIICVFFGHVAGLLIPIGAYHTLGVSDELYHMGALGGGGVAGIATVIGVLILVYRRFSVSRIRMTSSTGDIVALLLLTVVVLTGMLATTGNALFEEFDYRTTIGPWIRGILTLTPDPSLMQHVPVGFKIHIVAAISLFAVFPFTRLVHIFSVPLTYLSRSYVVYRKRVPNSR